MLPGFATGMGLAVGLEMGRLGVGMKISPYCYLSGL